MSDTTSAPPGAMQSNFDRLGSDFAKRDWVHDTRLFKAIEPYLLRLPDGLWLELGCGTGAFSAMAQRSNVQTIGLDISSAMLKASAATGPLSALVLADSRALPVRTSCLEAVLCRNLLKHVQRNDAALREAKRVLKLDRGRLLIVESCALDDVDRAFMNRLIEITEPEQQPYKTVSEMIDQLSRTGFEVLDYEVLPHTVGSTRDERIQQYGLNDCKLAWHWNHFDSATPDVRQRKKIVLNPDGALSFTLFWAIVLARPARL